MGAVTLHARVNVCGFGVVPSLQCGTQRNFEKPSNFEKPGAFGGGTDRHTGTRRHICIIFDSA
jgi:hypothetical protein